MIAIGSDFAGYDLKMIILDYLKEKGQEVEDLGCFDKSVCDYPDYAEKVCRAIQEGKASCGILICGTGVGMSIAANKMKGIRCVCCSDPYSAAMGKQHNNANVLAFGARVVGSEVAKSLVDAYLGAEFLGGRHEARVEKIMNLERS